MALLKGKLALPLVRLAKVSIFWAGVAVLLHLVLPMALRYGIFEVLNLDEDEGLGLMFVSSLFAQGCVSWIAAWSAAAWSLHRNWTEEDQPPTGRTMRLITAVLAAPIAVSPTFEALFHAAPQLYAKPWYMHGWLWPAVLAAVFLALHARDLLAE